MPSWEAFERTGAKRLVLINHRRSGKDLDTWNKMICRAVRVPGIYYYLFPTFAQGRKVIWEGMTNEGRPFLDFIPKAIIEGKPKEDEMQVRVKCLREGIPSHSIIQIVGTDHYDHIMGTNPIGMVLSEYALQDPYAWLYFRPILAANHGWAIFCYTPRGDNHGKELYEMALEEVSKHDNKDWYLERLSITQTYSHEDKDGNLVPIVTAERIEQERREGVPEELIQQEYYCSFNAGMAGAYYADIIERAESEGRIGNFDWNPDYPVDTYWDIGFTDATAIWFSQEIKGKTRFINFYSDSGKGLTHYIRYVKEEQYVYGNHYAPHDLSKTEYGSGATIDETARRFGIRFNYAPNVGIQDGIDTARRLLSSCLFDRNNCEKGLKALKNYRKKFDEKRKVYMSRPLHDWTSDCADAFRYAAVSITGKQEFKPGNIKVVSDFDVWRD